MQKIVSQGNFDQADLSGLVAADINLNSANLYQADLMGTLLADANLKGADLRKIHLQGAKLELTNLNGANLDRMNLRWSYLPDLKEGNIKSVFFDAKTRLEGAFTTDSTWLGRINSFVAIYPFTTNNNTLPFSSKKYKLVKLDKKEFKKIIAKYPRLKLFTFFWNRRMPYTKFAR